MIIKGNARAGAKSLADHLLRADTNERVAVTEIRGTVAGDLHGAFKEIEAVALNCTNTGKAFYHASINVPVAECLTLEQREIAIARLEKELSLEDQPRAVVVHVKNGREHTHIVWSRADVEHGRAIRMDHNYRSHEVVARDLEHQFGHARVQGAHIEREGRARPGRTPAHAEMQQAARTGWTPQAARALITDLWRTTDSGRAFEAALAEKGWLLAKGDRRDFVVVDPQGGIHSLARRIEGGTVKQTAERLSDLKGLPMPSAQEARAKQLEIADLERLLKPPSSQSQPTAPADWTDRGGMAQQQRSALQYLAALHRPEHPPDPVILPASSPAPSGPDEPKLTFYKDLHPEKDRGRDR